MAIEYTYTFIDIISCCTIVFGKCPVRVLQYGAQLTFEFTYESISTNRRACSRNAHDPQRFVDSSGGGTGGWLGIVLVATPNLALMCTGYVIRYKRILRY